MWKLLHRRRITLHDLTLLLARPKLYHFCVGEPTPHYHRTQWWSPLQPMAMLHIANAPMRVSPPPPHSSPPTEEQETAYLA